MIRMLSYSRYPPIPPMMRMLSYSRYPPMISMISLPRDQSEEGNHCTLCGRNVSTLIFICGFIDPGFSLPPICQDKRILAGLLSGIEATARGCRINPFFRARNGGGKMLFQGQEGWGIDVFSEPGRVGDTVDAFFRARNVEG